MLHPRRHTLISGARKAGAGARSLVGVAFPGCDDGIPGGIAERGRGVDVHIDVLASSATPATLRTRSELQRSAGKCAQRIVNSGSRSAAMLNIKRASPRAAAQTSRRGRLSDPLARVSPLTASQGAASRRVEDSRSFPHPTPRTTTSPCPWPRPWTPGAVALWLGDCRLSPGRPALLQSFPGFDARRLTFEAAAFRSGQRLANASAIQVHTPCSRIDALSIGADPGASGLSHSGIAKSRRCVRLGLT